MAESAVLDPETEEQSSEQQTEQTEPDRGGRPRGPKRYTRESSADERTSFFEYSSGLTETEWERHVLYVYMWAPIVDLTKGGTEKKYRKIYTSHKSEEDIKRDLGSGTYELKLNKIDPQSRKEKTIKRLVISIVDYDFPPNIPPGQWLDDSRNIDWLWAKPKLEEKYRKVTPQANGAPTWTELLQFMRDESHRSNRTDGPKEALMSSVVSILPQLLQQQNNAQDPAKIIDAMSKVKDMIAPDKKDNTLEIVKLVMDLAAPKEKKEGVDPMMTFVMGQLTRLQESNDKLFQQVLAMTANQAKPPDVLSQVETIASVFTKVSEFAQNAGPQAPRSVLETAVETGLPRLLSLGEMWLDNRRRESQQQRRPQATSTAPQPISPGPAQPAQPAQPEALNPEVVNPGGPGSDMSTTERSILINLAQKAAMAMDLGITGDAFAETVCYKLFNQSIYDGIIAHPKEEVLATLKNFKEAWEWLAPFEAQLPTFLDEFYNYAEEPIEPEPQPKPAPKPNKKGAKK